MRLYGKAFLLSALVLPGLGQLIKKDRTKGIILILLVNIFLLASFYFVLQGMGQLLVGAKLSGAPAASQILDDLKNRHPGVKLLMAGFLVVWAYGAADALLAREKDA